MRLRAALALIPAALLLAACSSENEPTQAIDEPPASAPAETGRGATQARIGEPVQRADGAYTITLDDVTVRTDCSTYGEDRSPADTGDKLIVATFTFETSDIPLPSQYMMPLEFYTVTGNKVASVPNSGGEYSCRDGSSGREDLLQPFSNSSYERVETFLVPIEAEWLGHRDPDTRQAFEWDISEVASPVAAEEIEPTPASTTPAYTPEQTYAPTQTYVPTATYSAPAPQTTTSSLEYNCSDISWRESMGAEGDRLCGTTWGS